VFVPCKGLDSNALLKTSINFSALAGATTNFTYTIPTGRGVPVGYQVVAGTGTIADAAVAFLTFNLNGVNVEEDSALSAYIPANQNANVYRLLVMPEQAKLNGSVLNNSGNAIPVSIILFYQDPYLGDA
jgi:predicted carbohydrate-binding protein with CBM5 and CBM33 domain